jgi:4-amino-4-deoxy-L-arabinose transferase-like glycosyltransferase
MENSMKVAGIIRKRLASQKAVNVLLIYTASIHAVLFIYDLFHPDVFLNADRATQRLDIINLLYAWITSGTDLSPLLKEPGIIGDYIFHFVLYATLGQYGVILFQIILLLISVYALFHTSMLVSRSRVASSIAVLFYIHFPHTLVFPHQLISEAIFVPLTVLSFFYLARYVLKEQKLSYLLISALFIGTATIVRPTSVLWPFFVVAVIFFMSKTARRFIPWAGYIVIATAPLILWMSLLFFATGKFTMGSSNHDVPHNLYDRVARMISTFPEDEQLEMRRKYLTSGSNNMDVITISEYLDFVFDHPRAYISHLGRDALAFWMKSGVSKLSLDYLAVFNDARKQLQTVETGWRKRFDTEGIFASAFGLAREYPALIYISIAGSVLLILFHTIALYGALLVFSRLREMTSGERVFSILLLTFPIYAFLVMQVVDAIQSRYRAPAEFALAILMGIGLQRWANRKNSPV